jgi:hypothetical protein
MTGGGDLFLRHWAEDLRQLLRWLHRGGRCGWFRCLERLKHARKLAGTCGKGSRRRHCRQRSGLSTQGRRRRGSNRRWRQWWWRRRGGCRLGLFPECRKQVLFVALGRARNGSEDSGRTRGRAWRRPSTGLVRLGRLRVAETVPERVHGVHHLREKICVVPESKTTSPWLDSKEQAAYDASTLEVSEVGAHWTRGAISLRVCAWLEKPLNTSVWQTVWLL